MISTDVTQGLCSALHFLGSTKTGDWGATGLLKTFISRSTLLEIGRLIAEPRTRVKSFEWRQGIKYDTTAIA